MNMIEKVARAMIEAGVPLYGDDANTAARIALTAMREPTEAMATAGGMVEAEVSLGGVVDLGTLYPGSAGKVFVAMIDAALAEG